MAAVRVVGLVVAAFVAGTFVASPELRAFAAATIGSADLIDESIQSVDIKNGQVKTADLAGSAVTSAKISDGTIQQQDLASTAVPVYKASSKMTLSPTGPQILSVVCGGLDKYVFGSERLSTVEPISSGFARHDSDTLHPDVTKDDYFARPNGFQVEIENTGTNDLHVELSVYCLKK